MRSRRSRRAPRRRSPIRIDEYRKALEAVALRIEAEADDAGWGMPPSIILIEGDLVGRADVNVDLEPILDRCAIEALVALDVPPRCTAVGLVAEAVAHDAAPSAPDPCAAGTSHSVQNARTVVLVDRDGAAVSVLRRRGEAAEVMAPWPESSSGGRVHDLCRIALGLTTAPPPLPTIDLWAIVWLDRLVSAGGADPEALAHWPDAATLHPAVEALATDTHAPDTDIAASELHRLGRLLGALHTWHDLRRDCAAGALEVTGLKPSWAAQLDDGSFARWVLGGFPSATELVELLRGVAPAAVVREVVETLAVWNVWLDIRGVEL